MGSLVWFEQMFALKTKIYIGTKRQQNLEIEQQIQDPFFLTQLSANWLKKVVEPPEPNSSTGGKNFLQNFFLKPEVAWLISEQMSSTPPRSMNTCLEHKERISFFLKHFKMNTCLGHRERNSF